MNKENYMNQYKTPEEFIYNAFVTNRGYESDCILTKKEMYKLIVDNKIKFKKEKPLNYIKKSELLNALLTKFSYEYLSQYVGVRHYCFMDKFNITNKELEYLSTEGIVRVNIERLRIDTRTNTYIKYYLYDVYDYFNLEHKDINKYLRRI